MTDLNLGPMVIHSTIPMYLTINRAPWVVKQLQSDGYDPLKTVTLIPAQDMLTFHIKHYLYKAVESEFVFPDADKTLVHVMPDVNHILVAPPFTALELSLDTDFYLALLVNDIKNKFRDVSDRFYNREVLFNPALSELSNVDHEMEWITNIIDRVDLESMIRAVIIDPSVADVLIVSYNKYRDFFSEDSLDSDEDLFA
jgi:hypothetical protein